MVSQKDDYVKSKIDYLATTTDKISGRAGLTLISRDLHECGITKILSKRFGFLKKHAKGTPLLSLFHQIIIFFFDGTDLHMTRFDQVKNDPGYAGIIETEVNLMISSHTAKRFFYSISNVRVWLFRKILKQLFLWRLEIEKPDMIKIGIDTMVLDNNDAEQREGVEPTYKKVKGFQPLQIYWGRYLIDAIFRNGKAHSNHGNHVQRMITDIVKLIRTHYSKDVRLSYWQIQDSLIKSYFGFSMNCKLDLLLAIKCTKILRFTSMVFLIISSTSTRKVKNVVPLRICK